ncbi:sugar phosphate isomerase/epimerase family protein [Confluentibacter flavum]|uniref:Endonuclease n=1 Tax=Confluentibacter flavum TaxID=1909700 RepID=A0A2N3HK96_9FLAO|nr:TIM barrel protein [Confluentibacter flavum]PKQ45377.1 endonuclease [Confluentibacter flavum]
MKRKEFISTSLLGVVGLSSGQNFFTKIKAPFEKSSISNLQLGKLDEEKMKICIFSKQLQWLNYQDMAYAVAEMGYDGIDLTVRDNGHVLPERVEEDLPKAVDAAKSAGIEIMMISTDIINANEPKAERILKTAAGLGIHHLRTNGLNYQPDLDIPCNIEKIKQDFIGLSEINKKYGVRSDYLNHSGEGFGSSLWDLWLTLKDLNHEYIGSQYDIKHATISGAHSWPTSFKLIHKYVRTMVVRDFRWEKIGNKWEVIPVAIGEGMVDFDNYFKLVKKYEIKGPISVMCDYNLGGAENGSKSLMIPEKDVLDAMRKDLLSLKSKLELAGIR